MNSVFVLLVHDKLENIACVRLVRPWRQQVCYSMMGLFS